MRRKQDRTGQETTQQDTTGQERTGHTGLGSFPALTPWNNRSVTFLGTVPVGAQVVRILFRQPSARGKFKVAHFKSRCEPIGAKGGFQVAHFQSRCKPMRAKGGFKVAHLQSKCETIRAKGGCKFGSNCILKLSGPRGVFLLEARAWDRFSR